MQIMPRIAFGFGGRPAPEMGPRPDGVGQFLVWIGGFLATGAALAVGAVLTVFAAAAVAVIALFASVLVFLAGLALSARRRIYSRARRAGDAPVIEARKVGHAWVAYGWDRNAR
jgi:hypothetical protein